MYTVTVLKANINIIQHKMLAKEFCVKIIVFHYRDFLFRRLDLNHFLHSTWKFPVLSRKWEEKFFSVFFGKKSFISAIKWCNN